MSPEEAELAPLDSDKNGKLGLEDFAKLVETIGEEERNGELKEAFVCDGGEREY